MLSFQHLDIQVTGPRAAVFRDAIVELLEMELGSALTPQVKAGFQAILNYSAGAMIYVRREYSDRIQLLRTSWLAAMHARLGQDEEKDFTNDDKELEKFRNDEGLPDPNSKRAKKIQATKVPENFNEMFLFNAAVMGFHTGIEWMMQVLDQFENMVLNASNVNRLQEECDVLALRLIKIKEPIVFSEFKAIMLASLRSLVPKVWGVEHEVAWTWFWDNLERMIKAQIGQLKGQQRAVERFIRNLSEESVPELCRDVYRRFFEQTPSGQNYFKQSTTRLYFIAGKVLELCMEIYQRPRDMVEDISALGLRHVGYGILTEHFSPFVEAWSQAIYARSPVDISATMSNL
ncbi:RNase H domain-containing protein [Durusdinium trenchii]|uniref:RNase H domain-containing protein n=1 Tax=Durusdinium trenchii TaxID=1381693 RepID=A0ABP0LAC7_9DINO